MPLRQAGGPGAEMTGDGRTRAEWNMSLMRDVIAPSYVRLLMVRLLMEGDAVHRPCYPR